MLDHVGFAVSDYTRSRGFYEKALAPLQIRPVNAIRKRKTKLLRSTKSPSAVMSNLFV